MINREEAKERIDAVAARFQGLLHQHHQPKPPERSPTDSRESWPIRIHGPAMLRRADGSGFTVGPFHDIVIERDGTLSGEPARPARHVTEVELACLHQDPEQPMRFGCVQRLPERAE